MITLPAITEQQFDEFNEGTGDGWNVLPFSSEHEERKTYGNTDGYIKPRDYINKSDVEWTRSALLELNGLSEEEASGMDKFALLSRALFKGNDSLAEKAILKDIKIGKKTLEEHNKQYPNRKPPSDAINPLFEMDLSIDTSKPAKEKEFALSGKIFPRRSYSLIIGDNGVGKSFLISQIVAQAVTGNCFMDNGRPLFSTPKPLKVLVISYEDDKDIFHARLKKAIEKYPSSHFNLHQAHEAVKQNLIFIDALEVFKESALLSSLDRDTNTIQPTETYYQLQELIERDKPDIVLIDPWHYATGAKENDNGEQGQHCALITTLAKDTGSAVVGVSHTSASNPTRNRGATSATDRVRQSFSFARLNNLLQQKVADSTLPRQSDLPEGLTTKDVIVLAMEKSSYSREWDRPVFFKRDKLTGLLIPIKVERKADQERDERQAIIDYINAQKDQEATNAMIEAGIDGFNQTKVSRKIKAMTDSGELVIARKKGRSIFYKVASEEDCTR